jgi:hypothetical protein
MLGSRPNGAARPVDERTPPTGIIPSHALLLAFSERRLEHVICPFDMLDQGGIACQKRSLRSLTLNRARRGDQHADREK